MLIYALERRHYKRPQMPVACLKSFDKKRAVVENYLSVLKKNFQCRLKFLHHFPQLIKLLAK